MNPLTLTLLFLLMNQSGSREAGVRTPYLLPPPLNTAADSFQIELLLDRLHSLTDTLEKVSGLAHMSGSAAEAVSSFPAPSSDSAANLKNLGDFSQIISKFGPILSTLANSPDK